MSKISDRAEQIARPIVEENGCRLWDVEYVREAGAWYLRVYIDKDDGVSINDCETISRQIDPILDKEDFIPDSYVFEVCSAGADRVLKRTEDFQAFLGKKVDVGLYKPFEGAKSFTGILTGRSDSETEIDVSGRIIIFENAMVAQVRLHVDF
ncbi:MAG: ribosome maturation factor RimP [Oscillospiraceae bacterium]|nr:ribosome maturation factor RimP [Oscillospiraceae bacterium]